MQKSIPVLFILVILFGQCKQETKHSVDNAFSTWQIKGGDHGSRNFSSLDQINLSNVSNLKPAWIYHSGGADTSGRTQIQCSPIIIDSVIYATTPTLELIALHGATGKEIWRTKPEGKNREGLGVNRGVMYWTDGVQKRIFLPYTHRLFSYDAVTGAPVLDFGQNGSIDMHDGLGEGSDSLMLTANTPGVIYKNMIIMGCRVSEGPDAAPGYIRSYDVHTGKLIWVFRTIPYPGEPGHETWPADAYNRIGGANSWSGMSLDTAKGIVYVPTGSAAFDFYGGNRKGQNLYANCILALDANNGKLKWHYQTTHHDILDRDLPSPPVLITTIKDGKKIDALAQATKQGYLFVLNRETGEPIWPIEEVPMPKSDLPGEEAWPTQPIPTKPKPYARQYFTDSMINDINPATYSLFKQQFDHARSNGPYLPPGLKTGIVFPGYDGGAEWGGQSYDPESGVLYLNSNEMPWLLTMVDLTPDKKLDVNQNYARSLFLRNCAVCHGPDMKGDGGKVYPAIDKTKSKYTVDQMRQLLNEGRRQMPSFKYIGRQDLDAIISYVRNEPIKSIPTASRYQPDVPYTMTGYNRFVDADGTPAVKPPWGTLNAINLNTGEYEWTVPLGEIDSLTKRGIPVTGTENYGGLLNTKGGLIFIGATKDERFRAFDKKTGKMLWQYQLPAGGYATPATYAINGKQYVVIACGGGKMRTKSGDSYIAFALE